MTTNKQKPTKIEAGMDAGFRLRQRDVASNGYAFGVTSTAVGF